MTYIRHSRNRHMLSEAEERSLLERHFAGDEKATREIVESHEPLVNSVAGRYSKYGPKHEDFFQEGMVGLVEGLKRFDLERGVRFSTYARWWIMSKVVEKARSDYSLIRIGTTEAQVRLFSSMSSVKRKLGIFSDVLSFDEAKEIAEVLNVKVDEVLEMSVRLSPMAITSLNAPMSQESDEGSRIDNIPDPRDRDQIENDIDLQKRRKIIQEAMATLDERKRDIINRRYLNDRLETLEEVSQIYGLTRERVRQIESATLKILGKKIPKEMAFDFASGR